MFLSAMANPKRLAKKSDSRKVVSVFPDCAYSLEVPATDISSFEKRERPVVGIAPFPYGDPRLGGAEWNTDYVRGFHR